MVTPYQKKQKHSVVVNERYTFGLKSNIFPEQILFIAKVSEKRHFFYFRRIAQIMLLRTFKCFEVIHMFCF